MPLGFLTGHFCFGFQTGQIKKLTGARTKQKAKPFGSASHLLTINY